MQSALYDWGSRLLERSGKRRRALEDRDLTLRKLGYYTDNGAYYYYTTEPGYAACLPGFLVVADCVLIASGGRANYEQTMRDVRADHLRQALPVAYYQLDSWWYGVQRSHSTDGSSFPCRGMASAAFCVPDGESGLSPSWVGRYYKGTDGGVTDWVPRPDVFPDGMLATVAQLGSTPLLLAVNSLLGEVLTSTCSADCAAQSLVVARDTVRHQLHVHSREHRAAATGPGFLGFLAGHGQVRRQSPTLLSFVVVRLALSLLVS